MSGCRIWLVEVLGALCLAGCAGGSGSPCLPLDLTPGAPGCPDEDGDSLCDQLQPLPACDPAAGECFRAPFGLVPLYTAQAITLAGEFGATLTRPEIAWDAVEPERGVFDFSGVDEGYDALRASGLEVIVSLRAKRGWGTRCDPDLGCNFSPCPHAYASCPPADLRDTPCAQGYSPDLYRFATRALEHLFDSGREIKTLIVENEVNTRVFWHGTDDEYLRTRATVYLAVHDFNRRSGRRVEVVDNGIASDVWGAAVAGEAFCAGRRAEAVSLWNRFFARRPESPIDEAFLADRVNCQAPPSDYTTLKAIFRPDPVLGVPTFDRLSYHYYAPWGAHAEVLTWMRAEMQANGYQRPILLSEAGYDDRWHDYQAATGEELKRDVARQLVQNHALPLAAGVDAVLWLPLVESLDDGETVVQYKGLLTPAPEMVELPAATAYRLMTDKLGGFSTAERLAFGGAEVFRFDVGGAARYVLWSATGATLDLSAEVGGAEMRLTALDGSSRTVPATAVDLTPDPVFAESP